MNNYSTDGFNERTNYIKNSNDINRLKENECTFDNSFAKMRTDERKNMVETTDNTNVDNVEETRGNKDNFIVRNNNMMNANSKVNYNNPVQNALNRNMFKKF